MKKSTMVLIGTAGALGLGLMFLGGGEAQAAPAQPPAGPPDDEPDDDDDDDDDLEDDDEQPGLDELPPGELPTDDLIEEAEKVKDEVLKRVPPPPDRVTVDPVETEPPTPVEDDDLLDRVKKELPKPEDIPDELPPGDDVDETTEDMVVELLEAEATPNWKRKSEAVRTWQRMRGLKPDSMFGPGSARMLAQETGLLPIVRYWPAGSTRESALRSYRADLREIASEADSPRKEHLLKAAQREQGQGFGTPPKPITTTIEFKA